MKKAIKSILFLLVITGIFSCTKKADIAGIEPKLPKLQVSSLGYQQVGPFTATNVLLLNFGSTTTSTTTGAFKLEVLSGTTVVKTINFVSWSGKDDTSIGTTTVHTISNIVVPTNYPNTTVYQGSIGLKLSALGLVSGTTYTLKATGYSADGTLSSAFTLTSAFKFL